MFLLAFFQPSIITMVAAMMFRANEKNLRNISFDKSFPISNDAGSESELGGVRHLQTNIASDHCALDRNALLCFNRYKLRRIREDSAV